MHPVEALKLLFGPLARYLTASAKPLPDGMQPARGLHPALDWRDPDGLCEAGRLSRALYRVRRKRPGGEQMAAMLEAYYSRSGQKNHSVRLRLAIEDMQQRGHRLSRRRGQEGTAKVYCALLNQGVKAFSAELHGAA